MRRDRGLQLERPLEACLVVAAVGADPSEAYDACRVAVRAARLDGKLTGHGRKELGAK